MVIETKYDINQTLVRNTSYFEIEGVQITKDGLSVDILYRGVERNIALSNDGRLKMYSEEELAKNWNTGSLSSLGSSI